MVNQDLHFFSSFFNFGDGKIYPMHELNKAVHKLESPFFKDKFIIHVIIIIYMSTI